MRRRSLLVCLLASPLAAQQKKSKEKLPEVELLDASAHLEENRINVDGHVKNVRETPIRKLTIFYELLDPDRKVLTRQQGPIEAAELAPGEESGFQAQMALHARAVWFQLSFEDGGGRELRAEKTGPFPIEQ